VRLIARYDIRHRAYVRERTENFGFRREDGAIRSGRGAGTQSREETNMLYTIAVILVVLWLLGLVTSYTMGGFIHILLVVAIIVVLLRVINGRTPL
jgi:predicted ferric reductase